MPVCIPDASDCKPLPGTALEWALLYADEMRWHVFPAPRGEKKSHKSAEHSNGRRWGATTDPAEIKRDFARWPLANVGIPTGRGNAIFDVETDTVAGHGVDGAANLRALEDQHGALPTTLSALSPTGSVHRIFGHPGGDAWVKTTASEIAKGVDVRGDGGMFIAPPSIKPNVGAYCWSDWGAAIADAPRWLLDLVTRKDGEPHDPSDTGAINGDLFELAYALSVVPNGDDVDFHEWVRRAMAIWRATGGSEYGFKLFDDHSRKWHAYDARNTQRKWDDISKSPPTKIGGATIFWLADRARPEWRTEAKVARLNEQFAFVLAGDKGVVMKFEKQAFRLLKVEAFMGWHANKGSVKVGKKLKTIAQVWIGHPMRREYAGIEFDPTGKTGRPGYYNLWRGFAVEPREGDCSLFLAHVRDNVAQGDEAKFKWIMGWFADVAQNPGTKQGTSLVLRGEGGVGKTKVGEIVGSVIGDAHYELVASSRYVVGQFNAHMASLLLLQADEAFWAGDKTAEGRLKDLVTGNDHRIEFKGIEPIKVKNFMRLLITSNAEWVVPAMFGERRFAIFDVGNARKEDHPYFAAIDAQMDGGGREALLHYLLHFDLSTVKLRSVPATKALLDQQIASMTPEQSWWLDVLRNGQLPRPINDYTADQIKNSCFCWELYSSYVQHAQQQGVSRRQVETKIGIFLTKMIGPELKRHRLDNTSRDSCYIFPTLKDCRDRFAKAMRNAHLEWDDRGDWTHLQEAQAVLYRRSS